MGHHAEDEHRRPAADDAQGVWQSLHQQEGPGMEMTLTTDQLCAKARYRERENVWGQRIAAVVCLGSGVAFAYGAITMQQIWLQLGQAWMVFLMGIAVWGVIRNGARRIQSGESCAQFMVRELEGSRRTLLAIRWGIVFLLPSLFLFWWGGDAEIRANALHLDPASWRYYFLTSPWRIVVVLLSLLVGWVGLGLEARKRALQADELRRAIGIQA